MSYSSIERVGTILYLYYKSRVCHLDTRLYIGNAFDHTLHWQNLQVQLERKYKYQKINRLDSASVIN